MSVFEKLGLPEWATESEVKAKWRELASVHHPDRGGDAAEFARLRKAYEQALEFAKEPKPCDACQGTGKVSSGHGWSTISLICQVCQGAKT